MTARRGPARTTTTKERSAFARGDDVLIGIRQLLDRAPKGRDEDVMSFPMDWVRRKDELPTSRT